MQQPPGPPWIDRARSYIGQREIKGPRHNPLIVSWWQRMGSHFRDDETPWCGAFVGGVLVESGLPAYAKGAAARAWLSYGKRLDRAAYGAVAVLWRGSRNGWSGHVGFLVGYDQAGNLMLLGGNQGDEVNIRPFAPGRLLGYVWPSIWPAEERFNIPVLRSDGRVSTNEA